jgi:hypothetical protein
VRSPAPLCCFLGITRTCRGSGYCPHCGVAESEHGVPDLPVMGQLGSHWGTGREASSNVQGRSSRQSKVGWLGATVLSSSFPLFLFRCCSLPPSSLALPLSPFLPPFLSPLAANCQFPSCPLALGSLLILLCGHRPRSVASLGSLEHAVDLVTALTVVWRRVSMGFQIYRLWGS